jgi:hypothetical protein
MIELIADLLFFASIVIIVITMNRGIKFSGDYADYHSGQIVISIVIIYSVSAVLSFLGFIYAPYKLGINIYFTDHPKFETGLHLAISSIVAYCVSSKVLDRCINFFMKEGDLVRKKKSLR